MTEWMVTQNKINTFICKFHFFYIFRDHFTQPFFYKKLVIQL